MPPLYTGSADEWSYLSSNTAKSSLNMEFIIDNFEERMKKPEILQSHQFTVKDSLWHIEVNPESLKKENKGNVGVFLANDNEEEFTVSCEFKIGKTVRKYKRHKVAAKSDWGYRAFFTHEKCKEELKNGKLEVKVEIEVFGKEENTLISGKGSNPVRIPDIKVNLKIFEDKFLTDFSVVCNGKSFPCHKVFLAARSSVFQAMIESEMKESKEAAVKLDNFSDTVVENFVKYFYISQVDEEIMKENAFSFLELGEKYDMAELKEVAEQNMIANLSKENMLNFFLAGELYKGVKIKAAAKTFLKQNMKSLMEQDGWKEALKERDLVFELFE